MEEVKNYFISHIIPDNYTEEDSMKRLQFFGNFPEEPNKFYLGESFRTSFSREQIKKWESEGKLIKLLEPTILQREKDLWVNSKGQIFLADFTNPIQDKQKEYLGKYKQFTKAFQIVQRIDLPKIEFYHIIEK